MINLNKYLWITPFLSFIVGYALMQQMMHVPDIITPHLVGKHVHEIVPLVTEYNLNLRLLDHKEEIALPEGIILNQTPHAGTTIKQNQPLFVVMTKKPLTTRAPECVGMHIDKLIPLLQAANIHPRVYYIPHAYPEKICFAQSPQPDESLEKNSCIIYISSGNSKPIVWPNFIGLPFYQVQEFLQEYDIQSDIITHTANNYTFNNGVVIDQRPLAGTLITLDTNKPLSVQLKIS